MVIRNRFPVEQEIPAGVVVSIRMDLYRVKDGQRLAFVKSHGQPHRLRITAPGARSAMEILEGSGGSQIEKRIEELWGPSINGMLGGIDMTLYSRFKEKNPWAYFVEE